MLCPLHHAMFDYGVIALHPTRQTLLSIDDKVEHIGRKPAVSKHQIGPEFLEYHLEMIYAKVGAYT